MHKVVLIILNIFNKMWGVVDNARPFCQVYGDHAFELPPDHDWHDIGTEPPKRRTLEETLAFAREVERMLEEGKTAAAIKRLIQETGVHFMSPFFKLWSGFSLEQIRMDLAHIIQVLMKRLVKAVCGKPDAIKIVVFSSSVAYSSSFAAEEQPWQCQRWMICHHLANLVEE
jgi:hypothetical protein